MGPPSPRGKKRMEKTISRVLSRIDGRGYKAYKDLTGAVERVGEVRLRVVRVQGDPFAPPSVVEASGPVDPGPAAEAPVAGADYALRRAYRAARRLSMRGVGEGHSGELRLPRPGPVMIWRAASRLERVGGSWRLTLLAWVGLPSRRRRVLAGAASEILLERLPALWREAASALREPGLERWVRAWIEQEYIRARLPEMGLVAFVGDGSVLPRACGGCEEPLEGAVPFESPPSLRVEVSLPTGRTVTGMGVREGLTLVAGPAFHGKTTLLEALAAGVWNHVPGDGRELVVTRRDAFWVQSENGRSVSCTSVEGWVESLPGLRDPRCWSTSDASGATSAIASLQEAVEAGSRLILVDEDWTATNFIHRDPWTEEVTGKRTLLTISDMAPALKEAGVSLVIVASGSIPLLAAADTVIVMDEYRPVDATRYAGRARRQARELGLEPRPRPYRVPGDRVLVAPLRLEKPRLRGRLLESRSLRAPVDLSSNKQLEEQGQLETAVALAARLLASPGPMASRARRLEEALREGRLRGLEAPWVSEVRWLDVLHVAYRVPGLRVERRG